MGLQLIFCVEANKKAKTDYSYIKSVLNHFYHIDNRLDIKLSPVFLGGKGKYSAKSTAKQIDNLKRQFIAAKKNNQNVVIFCFDCDDYDSKPEDKRFLEEARQFCDRKKYEFVWFCKDIERVFLGKKVADDKKVQEAAIFAEKHMIENVSLKNLHALNYKNQRSNLCVVLDKYLLGNS